MEDIPEELKIKAIKTFLSAAHKALGPNLPCNICGAESETMLEPRPMQPKTMEKDLERQMIFDAKFPLGIYFCGNHSGKEITKWLEERGIKTDLFGKP